MINYIPTIYNDELFYSFVARYAEMSGDTNLKNILKDFFGSETITPCMNFPCNISKFCSSVPKELGFNTNFIISKHTMLPMYSPFLNNYRRKQILKDMMFSNGQRIGYLLGIQAGSIVNTKQLRYCPLCISENINYNGEAYFHRVHQVDGILVCNKHGCKIRSYAYDKDKFTSRLKFISLDIKNVNMDIEYYDKSKTGVLYQIAQSAFFLLNNYMIKSDIKIINKRYKMILKEKGLLTIAGDIREQKVVSMFKKYYSDEILNMLNLNFNINDCNSWVRNILRNNERIINPIKHIVLILFLCDSIENFFVELKNEYEYFGNGPWPCLNPASNHYREKVVKNIKITADYKTRVPVGTFSCSCGFIYSRKKSDNDNEHLYKIGKIKQFGHVWETKLQSLVYEGNSSLREIARIMRCDIKTVNKYIRKIENGYSKTSDLVKLDDNTYSSVNENLIKYRDNLISTIKQNSNLTRTEIRKIAQKQYMWLYRNDKEWLFEKLPKNINIIKKNRNKVDWEQRDNNVLLLIKNAYNDIINCSKPTRVTKSRLGSLAEVSSLIYNKKVKLSKTEEFIANVKESVDEFQIRKVKYMYNTLLRNQGYVRKWQIVKLIGRNPSEIVKHYIDEYYIAKNT